MKNCLIVFIVVLGTFATAIAQGTTEFISGKVEFKIKNMGLNVNGTMTGMNIQFKQSAVDPVAWSLEGSVSPATISTGINLRDQHLKRSDYFDIANYPLITLKSTGIKAKGKNNYEGTFNLTIKGITKTVIIPFTIQIKDKSMDMEGAFTINRLDYGLGEESLILSDNATIRVYAGFKIL